MQTEQSLAYRFFTGVTAIPRTIIFLTFVMIVVTAAYIPTLTIDSRAESFLPDDDPALLYREQVEDIFGLKDPMVIAVINQGEHGVFNPQTLQLVLWLTDAVMTMPEINRDRVVSLATEDNITGNEEGMVVEPFFETPPQSQQQADQVRAAVMDFQLYLGSLVARDGSATLIVTEIVNDEDAPEVYGRLLELIKLAPVENGERIHLAGDGAVSGYLVSYINADAARLVPVSVVIITLLCLIAFRTWRGVLIPGVVILSAVATAVGLMAAAGVPVYVITTSMPILLVGIAVADSDHGVDVATGPGDNTHIHGWFSGSLHFFLYATHVELWSVFSDRPWRGRIIFIDVCSGSAGVAQTCPKSRFKSSGQRL
ncbi:MAG TPA: hypothetical protein ENJ32_09575 [Crenotrichaceae bacterium]|nr:hypothetical protein [Crenotrichaceae bacterium]